MKARLKPNYHFKFLFKLCLLEHLEMFHDKRFWIKRKIRQSRTNIWQE